MAGRLYTPDGREIPTRTEFARMLEGMTLSAADRERRQKGYDAAVAEAKAARRLEPPAPAAPQTGALQQAGLGVARDAPLSLAGLADMVLGVVAPQVFGPSLAQGGPQEGLLTQELGRHLPTDVPPQTPTQRYARAGARGAALAVPTAIVGGGLPAAALEVVRGAGGEMAAEGARSRGYGPLVQILAGIGGSAGTGVAARGMARGAGNVGRRIAQIPNRQAAQSIADEVLGNQVFDRAAAARRLAYELDPSTEAARFGTRASPAQALEDIAPGLGGLEKSYARAGGPTNALMFDQRRRNMQAMRDAYRRMFPEGAPADAVASYRAAAEDLANQVDNAFAAVGEIQGIGTGRLAQAVGAIRERAGKELAEALPEDVFKHIEGYGDEVSLSSLRRLRRLIVRNQAVTGKGSGDPEAMAALARLKGAVDETLDEVAKAGTQDSESVRALERALNLSREQGEKFGETILVRSPKGRMVEMPNPVTSALTKYEDPAEAVTKIITGSTPVKNLARLRAIVGDDESAWRGVETVVRRHYMGDVDTLFAEPHKNTVGDLSKFIGRMGNSKDRAVWEATFGAGSAKSAIAWAKRMRLLRSGTAGTTQLATTVGSGVATPEQYTSTARDLVAPMTATVRGGMMGGARALWRAVRSDANSELTDREARLLVERAVNDTEFARAFFERIPATLVPRWQRMVNETIKGGTAAGRTAATSTLPRGTTQ